MSKKALVLLSGGLDSATVLAIAKDRGYRPVYALSFDYGQRHRHEINAAKKIAKRHRVRKHFVARIHLPSSSSSLTNQKKKIPAYRRRKYNDIPPTYVPARNTIFLSYALGYAEIFKVHDIFIGVTAVDYSGYPDCRPKYIAAFEKTANYATKEAARGGRMRIHAPLIKLSKKQIIRKGLSLGVDYALAHSCYNPGASGSPCGFCDSCFLRAKGFREAGFADPALK